VHNLITKKKNWWLALGLWLFGQAKRMIEKEIIKTLYTEFEKQGIKVNISRE